MPGRAGRGCGAGLALRGAVPEGGVRALPPRARGHRSVALGQRAPTAYLSTAKEPSGPVWLLFLLICSFLRFEFCFLNQNQQEFFFLPALWG